MLTNRLETVRTGNQPLAEVRRVRYEDARAILIADYAAKGRLVEKDGEIAVAGRKGLFASLDDFFANMPVIAITTELLREFVAKRMGEGLSGPTCNRNLGVCPRIPLRSVELA